VRRKWPISRVLTVYYTLSASAILLLASAFLYYVMDSSSDAEDRQSWQIRWKSCA